ncbi:MAG: phage tail assembly protein [Acidobacteria bacterium]|nr:phage tail assembly protein [Acidobacteriota bacterium]
MAEETHVTVRLEHPVTVEKVEYSELKLRYPRVRDIRDARKGNPSTDEMNIRLFSNLAEVEPAVIEELVLVDYNRVDEALEPFT